MKNDFMLIYVLYMTHLNFNNTLTLFL